MSPNSPQTWLESFAQYVFTLTSLEVEHYTEPALVVLIGAYLGLLGYCIGHEARLMENPNRAGVYLLISPSPTRLNMR